MYISRPELRRPMPVADSWRRIERWLQRRLPSVHFSLRAGVSRERLSAFEEATGLSLPQDVRDSFLLHDGQANPDDSLLGVIAGQQLLGLSQAQASLETWRSIEEEWEELDEEAYPVFPPNTMHACYARAGWLPLTDLDGSCLGVDLEPGPAGRFGQVIAFGKDFPRTVLALSWAHFLEDFADELEEGALSLERTDRPGGLDWATGIDFQVWAEAKLPECFQEAAEEHFIEEGEPIQGDLANKAKALVSLWIKEMRDYELRWLKKWPLKRGCSKRRTDLRGGVSVEFTGPMTSGDDEAEDETPADPLHELLESMSSFSCAVPPTEEHLREMAERLQEQFSQAQREGKVLGTVDPRLHEALADKTILLDRFCTCERRPEKKFLQQSDPPAYDADEQVPAEVRRLAPDHVLVVLEPDADDETIRYHLLRRQGRWLIQGRERTRDGVRFKQVFL